MGVCRHRIVVDGSQNSAQVPLPDVMVHHSPFAAQADRNSACRTTVVDDQADFFEIDGNAWLSEEVCVCSRPVVAAANPWAARYPRAGPRSKQVMHIPSISPSACVSVFTYASLCYTSILYVIIGLVLIRADVASMSDRML